MQRYIESGHARVVKGDAHKPEDVARGWQVAQEGPNSHVDTVLFSIGRGFPCNLLSKSRLIVVFQAPRHNFPGPKEFSFLHTIFALAVS